MLSTARSGTVGAASIFVLLLIALAIVLSMIALLAFEVLARRIGRRTSGD